MPKGLDKSLRNVPEPSCKSVVVRLFRNSICYINLRSQSLLNLKNNVAGWSGSGSGLIWYIPTSHNTSVTTKKIYATYGHGLRT